MKSKKLIWDPQRNVAESAKEKLPKLASEFFAAGRRASRGKIKTKRLHEFRLLAKRFRYTLELFRPIYGPSFDKRLTQLRRLQSHLGKINDCSASRALLEQTRRKGKMYPKQKKVLRLLKRGERERIEKFLAFWPESFDAPGEEQRWVRYLRDYAGRGRGTAVPSDD